jgi:threonine dehydrogenase-like Zn-dependent dehydrogenase
MHDTMMQLRIVAPGRAEWRAAPVPEPGEGHVLLKVLGVTTCAHWDLHLMSGEDMFPGRPLPYPYMPGQPGHEAAGVVAAVGPGVKDLSAGMPIAAWRDPGHQVPGCYAQYVCLASEHVLQVPADLPPREIAPLELAMCVHSSFDEMGKLDAVAGARFCVSGLGPAGLIAVQLARIHGARHIVGIDPIRSRRELAVSLGADEAVRPGDPALPTGRTSSDAFDAAIDCAGLRASAQSLMDRTRRIVAVFGVLREDVRFGFEHWAGLTLFGSPPHNRPSAERALALVKERRLSLAPIVSHELPFTRYSEGVEMLRNRQATKVCFDPWAAV